MAKRGIASVFVSVLSVVLTVQALSQAGIAGEEPNDSKGSNDSVSQAQATDTSNPPSLNESDSGREIAELFKVVNWASITYTKTLRNPSFCENPSERTAENLTLRCQIEMPEPELVIGWLNDPVIEQITDTQGNSFDFYQVQNNSGLYYTQNHSTTHQRSGRSSKGQEEKTKRISLNVNLNEVFNKGIEGEIKQIRGHCKVLTAESVEYVDLPFEPNDKWVRVSPEMEIKVLEAKNLDGSYRYSINVNKTSQMRRRPMLPIGEALPNRLASGPTIIEQRKAGNSGSLGGSMGNMGTGVMRGSGAGRAEKIRYTIGVNPAHRVVPFEIVDVILPFGDPKLLEDDSSSSQSAASGVEQGYTNKREEDEVSSEESELVYDKRIAKWFDAQWDSITYQKALNNPAISLADNEQMATNGLVLHCKVDVIEPEKVLGVSGTPTISRSSWSKCAENYLRAGRNRVRFMHYTSMRYRPKQVPPSSLFRWESKLRRALGLSLKKRHKSQLKSEPAPIRFSIELEPDLVENGLGEIDSIKGLIDVLTIESFKHVKVPFEPNEKWVHLTEDVEIKIAEAYHDGSAYRYEIKERSQSKLHLPMILAGTTLPDEIVLSRELTGPDKQPNRSLVGMSPMIGHVGGRGSVGTSSVRDTFDFKIGIHPSQSKVPFEIKGIPLPKP